jgi:hypothetical protein
MSTLPGRSCPTCQGRGFVPVSASEGRGTDLFRLCRDCMNSGATRSPLTTPERSLTDLSGGEPRYTKAAPRVSYDVAIRKQADAYAKIQALAEQERLAGGCRISHEVALSKILKTTTGKRLYAEYDQAAHEASTAY